MAERQTPPPDCDSLLVHPMIQFVHTTPVAMPNLSDVGIFIRLLLFLCQFSFTGFPTNPASYYRRADERLRTSNFGLHG